MNQKTKKHLKITGIVIVCILAIMAILPYAFQDKIEKIVVVEGNKMLNARFNFESLNISLFKNFPKASITLNNFYIKGVGEFNNDTLVKSRKATAAIDLFSLFGSSGYDISKISLEDTYIHAIVLENGKTNWDIMKTDTTAAAKAEKPSTFRLKLKNTTADNLNVVYDDRQGKMYASVKEINAECSGDLTADRSTLKIEAESKAFTFKMGAIPYISNAVITAKMNLDADLANSKYTFKENEFQLNAIKTNVDGWVAMLKNGAMDMDLKLNTNEVQFKDVLSLIPAIYAKDFESVKTTGAVSLAANAKGIMLGDTLPAFNASMVVKNATFRYPSLPMGVDQININASVKNPGGSADLTEVNINPFSFRMAGNPFSLTAIIKTPVSDPDVKGSAKGTLNLGMIKQVYPLEEGMHLNGTVSADVNMAGRMSYIEKEQYDKFQASGSLRLSNMVLKMKDMPDVDIQKSTFTFSPKYLDLSETTVKIGKNDITANCKLENYMGYALKNKTIKGNMNIKSNYFNLNDFMGTTATTTATTGTATTTAPAKASAATSAIEIPKNIDFNMTANMKKVLFDKMTFNDMNGKMLVKDGKVDMQNLSMNTMGGSIVMNGSYSTAASVKSPDLNAGFKMNNLSFAQAYKEMDMVQKLAPIFENIKGSFSGNMNFTSKLDQELTPVFNSMQGGGSISTKDVSLSGVKVIDQIATAVKKESLKNMKVKDLKIDFAIKDGRVATKPFDIKLGETVLNLSGTTGLDQTIDYSGKIKLPASTGSLAQLSTLDLKIGGTFTSPKVSIDTKSMAKQAVSAVKEKALGELGKKLGVDLANAQKQKDALVAEAKKAGDKLVAEAQKQADALTEKAGGNILKKLAAQKAGEQLVKEAQKQSDKLVKEAEAQGDKLIEKAKGE
ncbi:membrane protein [Bacteroides sedimenti]|uniref:Membrane protein n=1 Tax=Bacteroides sedimenti TaxID=2136147 RepID=A0ABM8I7A2_9BACE